MTAYTITVTVDDDHESADQKIREALADQGFGILTEIDIQSTLSEKLGEDVGPYTILGACNPPLAHKAIGLDADVGALLPCNVVLRANPDGGTDIVAADPAAMLELGDDRLAEVAEEARRGILAALSTLGDPQDGS